LYIVSSKGHSKQFALVQLSLTVTQKVIFVPLPEQWYWIFRLYKLQIVCKFLSCVLVLCLYLPLVL